MVGSLFFITIFPYICSEFSGAEQIADRLSKANGNSASGSWPKDDVTCNNRAFLWGIHPMARF